ncbi:MAG: S46 family peptidase, partial [Myxococcota bacterium]|nr:S46 family peptidase [Myxococcota bacterium]
RSIGTYGGEKENWRWPRHTGDFALLRVYTGPNGENAFYDEANIPYRNPHFLRVSPEGISDKDFVLSIGYPRSTSRHSLYRELRYAKDVRYPFLIDISTHWLSIINGHMEQDPNAQRLFAAKQMISNTLVQNRGMLTNFSREDLLKTKSEQEESFIRWSAESPDREIYASAIKDLEVSIQKTSQHNLIDYLAWLSWSADLLYAAQSSYSWALERKKKDADRLPGYQNHNKIQFVSRIRTQDQRLYLPADKDLLRYMLQRPEVQSLPSLQEWIQKQGGVNPSISRLFSSLDILDTQTQLRLLDEPSEHFESSKNPWLELSVRVETLRRQLQAQQKEETERQEKLRLILVEGKEKANPLHFYPDADHSIRVGYGHVRGYRPKDALVYESQTTVAGQIEKLGPPPFDLPPHIVEQAAFRSQSPHIAPELNDIPCNFSTDLDISNGSSGSATLNAKGEWVGMVFDGNEGSMSNRWLYHPRFSRAIHVDVRYMLWYMETTATAQWIVRELLQDK